MAFKSIRELSGTGRSGRGLARGVSVDHVTLSTDICDLKGESGWAMRVAIHKALAKKARIIKGDRVDILFDAEARMGLIKRVSSGGWSLAGGQQNARLNVKVRLRSGMPTVAKTVGCESEITDEGILFTLPDEVSFTENLRASASQSLLIDE